MKLLLPNYYAKQVFAEVLTFNIMKSAILYKSESEFD